MFEGVFAALFTPFDENGEYSEPLMRAHLDFLVAKGLDGVYVGGNSGQGLFQTVDERKRVLDVVKDQAGDRLTIIAHVGSFVTRDAVELAKYANKIGCDGISSLPPIYWAYTSKEIFEYYKAINGENDLPCFVYYIPDRAKGLTHGLMLELGAIPQIKGLKFTDTNFFMLQDLLQQMDGKWIAFSGSDQHFLPALTMGVIGSIGANQNTMPELFVAIYRAFQDGDYDKAREYQSIVTKILAIRNKYGGIVSTKSILKLRGLDPGFVRAPIQACLEPDEEKALHDEVCPILEECDVFTDDVTR